MKQAMIEVRPGEMFGPYMLNKKSLHFYRMGTYMIWPIVLFCYGATNMPRILASLVVLYLLIFDLCYRIIIAESCGKVVARPSKQRMGASKNISLILCLVAATLCVFMGHNIFIFAASHKKTALAGVTYSAIAFFPLLVFFFISFFSWMKWQKKA